MGISKFHCHRIFEFVIAAGKMSTLISLSLVVFAISKGVAVDASNSSLSQFSMEYLFDRGIRVEWLRQSSDKNAAERKAISPADDRKEKTATSEGSGAAG